MNLLLLSPSKMRVGKYLLANIGNSNVSSLHELSNGSGPATPPARYRSERGRHALVGRLRRHPSRPMESVPSGDPDGRRAKTAHFQIGKSNR